MKYHFRAGRGKNIFLNSDTATFEQLGFEILKAYNIYPSHMFQFEFANGDYTNSATPLGPFNDGGEVPIDSKIKDRKLIPGDEFTFIYDYSSDWTRKVKLVGWV